MLFLMYTRTVHHKHPNGFMILNGYSFLHCTINDWFRMRERKKRFHKLHLVLQPSSVHLKKYEVQYQTQSMEKRGTVSETKIFFPSTGTSL